MPSGPLVSWTLPADVAPVRTTPVFTDETVPDGLRRAHRVAPGVWGLLRVLRGEVTFVLEDPHETRTLGAGDAQVIPSGLAHHVEPTAGARFEVEFHR